MKTALVSNIMKTTIRLIHEGDKNNTILHLMNREMQKSKKRTKNELFNVNNFNKIKNIDAEMF